MKKTMKQAGFTLTEMMIVIAIVGILLMVIIPNAMGVLDTAKAQGCDAYLKTVETQVQLYLIETKTSEIPEIGALVSGGYLPSATCPNGETITIGSNGSATVTE